MKAISLFSGGKDSVISLYKAQQKHHIQCLVSVHPEHNESYMYHYQKPEITELQAKALEKPLKWIETKAIKEKEIDDLKKGLKKLKKEINFEAVITGAIESNYQKTRIEKVCNQLDLKPITPLWQTNQKQLLKYITKNDFEVIITKVSAGGLTKKHLNKKINQQLIKELTEIQKKWRINLAGEGGEYETLVLDAPNYKQKIQLLETEKKFNQKQQKGQLEIKKAKLIPK
ncbi:diphthine--ammonia ligase [Methanonatronarchaeum sp. AMET-Sl]|uniref:diphthine--ammonia ligase n=1 Tax=Methanonatronarchaeum sp. AMET-Sl TaxID=3037654 RepID=UPI00244D9EC4|nr:diphthine--ammonia ligase [Methanonatronarchaeum sp. AMET-Sl]WGI16779.1 diphthine--ammonia ligase [Methanonatronarchaeum sp. AMET-Sl]